MKKNRNFIFTFLKIALTFILLYVVFSNIPLNEVWRILKQSNTFLLFLALISFILSQIVSANRLLQLFEWSGFMLDSKKNYILYLIGMFYNFFIPGGIGGDAYKIYQLNKDYRWPIKKITTIVFFDRLMGLIAIGILIILFCFFIPFFTNKNLIWLLIIALLVGLASSYFLIKWLFPSFLRVSIKSILKSILIQLLQCICIVLLLSSLSETDNYITYVIAFLISSVLSIFSFSGIGVREMILYQASTLFAFNSMKAVTIGLLFSTLTAFVSFFGIYFHFKKSNKI
ncbi:COG0392 Predicted integral membrane protein [Flavobacteriaceae bacterium]